MYVFGGALLPTEEVTNELWSLHLPSLTWELVNEMQSSGSGMKVTFEHALFVYGPVDRVWTWF